MNSALSECSLRFHPDKTATGKIFFSENFSAADSPSFSDKATSLLALALSKVME